MSKSKKEHIFSLTKKDFEIQTFQSGGKGGQHQNKTNTGVRIIHKESGAVGEGREFKSQLQNKKAAFERLHKHPKFKIWINRKVYELTKGKTLEESIDEYMNDKNIKIEIKNKENKWISIPPDELEKE